MNKKQDRRRLIIIAIIALLALLLGVGIYCIKCKLDAVSFREAVTIE